MQIFKEIVNKVSALSDDELNKIEKVIKKERTERRINEILEAAKAARLESKEGKTYVASSPEEIIKWFKDVMNDED
jgi:hypothetical protein